MSVTFKHEDEVGGEPVGPVFVDEEHMTPNRTTDGWVTLSEAREIAERCGTDLKEV